MISDDHRFLSSPRFAELLDCQGMPVEQSITVLVLIILKMEVVFKEFLWDKYGILGPSPSNIIIHFPPFQEYFFSFEA